MPPAPNNQFYITGGTLHPDAPSYVERQADHDLHDGCDVEQVMELFTLIGLGHS